MFTVKKNKIENGHDCWGRSEFDNVYDVYHNNEFVCRMMSDPTELINKVNNIVKKEESPMNKYIGTKMIEAEPMTKGVYNESRGRAVPGDPNDAGYLVKYQDGYESWSPKEVFDKAYMKVDDNTDLPSGGQKMVDEFIAYTETKTMGTKTTVVRCVLRNGFEIVESTGCVDEKNYSEMNLNYLIGFNKEFGDWNIGATIGGNRQRNITKQWGTDGNIKSFLVPGFESANNISNRTYLKDYTEYRVNSVYGRIRYS